MTWVRSIIYTFVAIAVSVSSVFWYYQIYATVFKKPPAAQAVAPDHEKAAPVDEPSQRAAPVPPSTEAVTPAQTAPARPPSTNAVAPTVVPPVVAPPRVNEPVGSKPTAESRCREQKVKILREARRAIEARDKAAIARTRGDLNHCVKVLTGRDRDEFERVIKLEERLSALAR